MLVGKPAFKFLTQRLVSPPQCPGLGGKEKLCHWLVPGFPVSGAHLTSPSSQVQQRLG